VALRVAVDATHSGPALAAPRFCVATSSAFRLRVSLSVSAHFKRRAWARAQQPAASSLAPPSRSLT
jgi:hypothetical protein